MVITLKFIGAAPGWWLKLRDQVGRNSPVTESNYCQVLRNICGFDVEFKIIYNNRGWTSGREVRGEETEITAMILKWS